MSTLILVRLDTPCGLENYSFDKEWRHRVLPAFYEGNGIYNVLFPYPPSAQDMCKGKTSFTYLEGELDLLITEYIS